MTDSQPTQPPWWATKTLEQMTPEEWESLCDRCGRCCLHKLEDEESGEVYYTSVACTLLDTNSCQCRNYPNRQQIVPECTTLTTRDIAQFHWLVPTCAYRLISEGRPLFDWHPLVSGSSESVHQAGISVRGWALSENDIAGDDLRDYIIPHTMLD